MPDTAISELKKAAKGITYVSETDSPVRAFNWKDDGDSLTAEKVLELSKADPSSKVEEVTPDDFFSTQDEGEYASLRQAIGDHLGEVRAFRVGDVNVSYYVVGKTKQGEWAGVWAKAVET